MRSRSLLLAVSLLFALTTACRNDDASLISTSQRVFGTITAASRHTQDSAALISLGRALYFSTELSANNTQSCNSCHPVEGHSPGADGKPTSAGALGRMGRRNTPTVFNADLHFAQFWDGRATTLEEQARGPILNPVEMALADHRVVSDRLRSASGIDRSLFTAAFPGQRDPYTLENAATAIAAFERTLHTHDRFDDFQNGNARALTAEEKLGLRKFMRYGCTSCHNGPLLGANRFQRIGIVNPFPNTADRGRAEITSESKDEFVFKVPSLRNVALTAPYFHDGSAATLDEAVDRMAWFQLGRKLPVEDHKAIVAFLNSLTGVR